MSGRREPGASAAPAARPDEKGLLARARAWWDRRPLAASFTACLVAYLAAATVLTLFSLELMYWLEEQYCVHELGVSSVDELYPGPYVYDAEADELLPAAAMELPGDNSVTVFVGTKASAYAALARASAPATEGDVVATVDLERSFATMDDVRSGAVTVEDWGANFDPVTEDAAPLDGSAIPAEDLAGYDALSRAGRTQSAEAFEEATGADLVGAFGSGAVSNVAYYVRRDASSLPALSAIRLVTEAAPFVVFAVLAWVTFRRFYRAHLEEPLAQLGAAAERIGSQDLDFSIAPVRGRELGRLAQTLEAMRSALLAAQRELWATAEERRRLNAAFAHDLRTPITVLKGTVEMALLRAARGLAVDEAALAPLSAQVERLERYVAAFSGVGRLTDRQVERERVGAPALAQRLCAHAKEVVAARGRGVALSCEASTLASAEASVLVDAPLVEEVLDNLLGNACDHAAASVRLELALSGAGVADAGVRAVAEKGSRAPAPLILTLCVADDGPGFSPEALRRGCDPFYSEAKSAEHFGLGLNVASQLAALHGGGVELANGADGGAVVTVTFDVSAGTEGAAPSGPAAPRSEAAPPVDGA